MSLWDYPIYRNLLIPFLDVQSLARLSRVSKDFKATIYDNPVYCFGPHLITLIARIMNINETDQLQHNRYRQLINSVLVPHPDYESAAITVLRAMLMRNPRNFGTDSRAVLWIECFGRTIGHLIPSDHVQLILAYEKLAKAALLYCDNMFYTYFCSGKHDSRTQAVIVWTCFVNGDLSEDTICRLLRRHKMSMAINLFSESENEQVLQLIYKKQYRRVFEVLINSEKEWNLSKDDRPPHQPDPFFERNRTFFETGAHPKPTPWYRTFPIHRD